MVTQILLDVREELLYLKMLCLRNICIDREKVWQENVFVSVLREIHYKQVRYKRRIL